MATRQLVIKNKLQADAMAKHYINDDRYLMMAPDRMVYIAETLINRCGSEYHEGLYKILEVCRHQTERIILPSRMNQSTPQYT